MLRPTRFFVLCYSDAASRAEARRRGWPLEEADPSWGESQRDYARKGDAFRSARAYVCRTGEYAAVYERIGIRDRTPPEDGRGLLWDWEDRLLAEIM